VNIILLRLRLAKYVARMVNNINEYRVLAGKPSGKRPHSLHTLGWMNIFKHILKNGNIRVSTQLIWLRIGMCGDLLFIQ
jgi:hypothetical protein